jgi:hypothetical protein
MLKISATLLDKFVSPSSQEEEEGKKICRRTPLAAVYAHASGTSTGTTMMHVSRKFCFQLSAKVFRKKSWP